VDVGVKWGMMVYYQLMQLLARYERGCGKTVTAGFKRTSVLVSKKQAVNACYNGHQQLGPLFFVLAAIIRQ